jgi:hypothetical protein
MGEIVRIRRVASRRVIDAWDWLIAIASRHTTKLQLPGEAMCTVI